MFEVSGLKWLRTLEMKELDLLILENHLSHIEAINLQIGKADGAIKEKACEDEDICLLTSLPGLMCVLLCF